MRLFIALPLPPDTRRALAAVQSRLRECSSMGRYVAPENFHITLHFLGESNAMMEAAAACDEAVRGIHPFTLRLFGYDSFARGDTRTGFVTLKGELNELRRLHETLIAALSQSGFPLTGAHKRFTPHITLARDVRHEGATPSAMEQACAGLGGGSAFVADKLILFQSRAVQGRMEYTPLHRAKLLR